MLQNVVEKDGSIWVPLDEHITFHTLMSGRIRRGNYNTRIGRTL